MMTPSMTLHSFQTRVYLLVFTIGTCDNFILFMYIELWLNCNVVCTIQCAKRFDIIYRTYFPSCHHGANKASDQLNLSRCCRDMAHPLTPVLLRRIKNSLCLLFSAQTAARTTPSSRCLVVHKELVEVASASLACEISIVRGWDEADRLCRTCIEIARIMRSLLDFIGLEIIFVIHNNVMCRLYVPLKACVCLQIEIEIEAGEQ